MPFLSSRTLIHAHTLLTLSTSFLLLTNPSTLVSSAPIWLIGEAMHIRPSPNFSAPSEPIALLAFLLAVYAVSESVFAGALGGIAAKKRESGMSGQVFAERAAILHQALGAWMGVAGVKTLVLGVGVLYCYLTTVREEGMLVDGTKGEMGVLGLGMLNNRVAFVGMFVEMLFWGYLWTNLKEELRELAGRIQGKREEMRENGELDLD